MNHLSKKTVKKLIKKKLKISIAESCTGGLLSNAITSIPGSSKAFNLGLVSYSNQSKFEILKVSKILIRKHGAVSEQVSRAMAINVSKLGKTYLSVSVTGIAGPSGGTKKKPVGLVYVSIKRGKKISTKKYVFKNKGRSYIQRATVNKCLKLILIMLK